MRLGDKIRAAGRQRRAFGGGIRDTSGAAAVEFAIWLLVLAYPLINVVDIGLYVYKSMQVSNAAQMALQSIFQSCGQVVASPPLKTNCSTFSTAETNGLNTTSLTAETITDTSECVSGTVKSGTQIACPSTSGDYVSVTVSYTFTPAFGLASITNILGNTIVRTHWMRMV